MIIALLELIAGTVLYTLSFVLGTLNFIIPAQIQEALSYFFQLPLYFNNVFPVLVLLNAILIYLVAWGLMYAVKIFVMVINMIPGVRIELPKHKVKTK